MPPDPVGRRTRRAEGVVALPDNRAGFEPFRGGGITDALPNLTRAAATTGVSLNQSVMPPARKRLKTSAGRFKRLATPWARRVFRPTGSGGLAGCFQLVVREAGL
jgi:hypothetical protein